MKEQSCATIPFIPSFLLPCSSTVRCLTPFRASQKHPRSASEQSQQILSDFLQCLAQKLQSTTHPIMEAIYTPQTTSFQQVLLALAKNRRYTTLATPKPLAIVAAKHERHVQATVICAKQHGLEIRIRSDGHDCEGLSYVSDAPFVILDMLNLRSIDVNVTEGRVWVQSGATVGELYYEVGKKSKVHGVAAGSCPSVGIGGHLGGCGNGPLLRKYGLTVDNVEDARLVNSVNGEILDRNSVGEDLFWAIRGGG